MSSLALAPPVVPDHGAKSASEANPDDATTAPAPGRGWACRLLVAVLVVAAGIGVGAYRAEGLGTFYVSGDSMRPTLRPGDDYIAQRVDGRTVGRGDIVVLTPPDNPEIGPGIKLIVKRVVAVAGDHVSIGDDGCSLVVNGAPAREPYLAPGTCTPRGPGFGTGTGPEVVPAGDVFVLGDNRTVSLDSGTFGPVPDSTVRYRAVLRYGPVDSIGAM